MTAVYQQGTDTAVQQCASAFIGTLGPQRTDSQLRSVGGSLHDGCRTVFGAAGFDISCYFDV
jgi:hypothetical protein